MRELSHVTSKRMTCAHDSLNTLVFNFFGKAISSWAVTSDPMNHLHIQCPSIPLATSLPHREEDVRAWEKSLIQSNVLCEPLHLSIIVPSFVVAAATAGMAMSSESCPSKRKQSVSRPFDESRMYSFDVNMQLHRISEHSSWHK